MSKQREAPMSACMHVYAPADYSRLAFTGAKYKLPCVQVGEGQGHVQIPFKVNLKAHEGSDLHLWSFDSPYLYDVQVSLKDVAGNEAVSAAISLQLI